MPRRDEQRRSDRRAQFLRGLSMCLCFAWLQRRIMASGQLGATVPSLRHADPKCPVPRIIAEFGHVLAFGGVTQEFL